MKKTLCFLFFCLFLLSAFSQSAAKRIFVSPEGNDANNGSVDKPLKTLEAAREMVRNFGTNSHPKVDSVLVLLREGTYSFTKTFVLNETDGGSKEMPVVYKAYHDEKVIFTGGVKLKCSEFKKVADIDVLSLLPSDYAKNKLVYIDLKQIGITDYGEMKHVGFNQSVEVAPMELFYEGEPMQLAQYPNLKGEFIRITSIIDTGSVPRNDDMSNRGATFKVDDKRVENWSSSKHLWVQGMFGTIWADDMLQIAELDAANHIFKTAKPHLYGVTGGQFRALNLLEELDTANEYYIDRDKGILYFLPPDDMKGHSIILSMLETPFIALENASYITFEQITFEYARGMGIYIEGGEGNRIVGCTLRNMGILAVSIGLGVQGDTNLTFTGLGQSKARMIGDLRKQMYADILFDRNGGHDHGIVSCRIYNMGSGGVSLGGGNRKSLDAAGNFVENCEIYNVNRWAKTYRPCVDISGVGNRISRCFMHDATHSAILLAGNDHLIEYNVFENTLLESNDVGVIYTGRDPSAYGCIIRYNLFKKNGPSAKYFPHPYSQGIYLDDFNSGTTVEGNIFTGVKTSVLTSGWDTKIKNNLIISCGPVTFQLRYFNETTKKRLYSVNPTQPPYSTHYPQMLKHLGVHEVSGYAYGSEVTNNICVYRDKKCVIYDKVPLDAVIDTGNISITEDPKFFDAVNDDYRLKPESVIFKLSPGFQNIPCDKIGLYPTKYFGVVKVH